MQFHTISSRLFGYSREFLITQIFHPVTISFRQSIRSPVVGTEAEVRRTQKRRELYDAQDSIDERRDELIENIELQLRQSQN